MISLSLSLRLACSGSLRCLLVIFGTPADVAAIPEKAENRQRDGKSAFTGLRLLVLLPRPCPPGDLEYSLYSTPQCRELGHGRPFRRLRNKPPSRSRPARLTTRGSHSPKIPQTEVPSLLERLRTNSVARSLTSHSQSVGQTGRLSQGRLSEAKP